MAVGVKVAAVSSLHELSSNTSRDTLPHTHTHTHNNNRRQQAECNSSSLLSTPLSFNLVNLAFILLIPRQGEAIVGSLFVRGDSVGRGEGERVP